MSKDKFIREWLDLPNHDPNLLSEYAVVNDRWDRKYVGQMLETIDDFFISHERLTKKVETGSPMWSDLFWLLWKYDPEMLEASDIRPSHLINHLVGEEMSGLSEFQRLKFFAEDDDVAAALACIDLRETLEQLFDKMKHLQDRLQQIMDQFKQLSNAEDEKRDLDEMVKDWKEGYNPDDKKEMEERRQDLDQTIQELQEALEATDLEEEVRDAQQDIRASLEGPMKEAADKAEAQHAQGELWGDEKGFFTRMSANERMELARRLQDGRFKHLLSLIGPMRRIMEEAQMRKVDYARDEVYTITLGDDLSRVLPSELSKVHHPLLKRDFKRRLLEKELLQYELRGKEKVGKGEIIACIDTSGSMHGEKEMWAKAVGICALHLARKQKRGFYGILFSSAQDIATFDFGLDEEFTPQKVIDFAELNFFGGTDFMRPLSYALDRLRDEHAKTGKVRGDIMFITDGQAEVQQSWLDMFKEEQKRLEFKVWGFVIGGTGQKEEPLWTITDGNVFTVKDLLNPSPASKMFEAL